MRTTHTTRRAIATRALALSAVTVAVAASSVAAATTPPPGTPHSQVVAQRVLDFGDGPYSWSVEGVQVLPDADATTLSPASPTFIVVDDGSLAVIGGGTDVQHLTVGQAAFVPAGGTALLRALDEAPAAYFGIALNSGPAGGGPTLVGAEFTPGAGSRDVELVSDVVAAGETTTLGDAGAAHTLVLVTSGVVTIATSAGTGGATLGNGEARVLDGELSVTNAADGPATLVAAVIGGALADVVPTTTTVATAPQSTGADTTAPATDSDTDGLSDAEETALGTDPNRADSDGDAIDDGDEVHNTGSDPLKTDTDGDEIEDYPEVDIYNTNPAQFDTDGDGVGDGTEVFLNGTDPKNPDSDGDGLNDGAEASAGTNPTNTDSDLDGTGDGTDTAPLDPTVA